MSQKSPLQILPWNGFKAAISLTFDDGDISQLESALPEMQKRDITGTFFLITNRLKNIDAWKAATEAGQEIGNHTLDHRHAKDLTSQESIDQVKQSRQRLEEIFKVSVPTFAYPFTELTPQLRKAAEETHFISRGGYGPVYFDPVQQPDWQYLPSQVAFTHTSSGVLKGWTDENILNGTWSIPQFHGFAGSQTGWQPLPLPKFEDFLDDLVERKKEIWIATLGQVGAYWQAQDLLENAEIKKEGDASVVQWKKPSLLPSGTILKVLFDDAFEIQQKNKKLTSANGIYSVDFDLEEVKIIHKL